MRNPRRDAAEYAVLLTLGATVTIGIGIMLTTDFRHDSKTGQNAKIDFRNAQPINVQDAMKELRQIKYRGLFGYKKEGGPEGGGNSEGKSN